MKKITFLIGENEYELRYDINALIDLSNEGVDVLNFDKVKIDMKNIRLMFKVGLKHQFKKITDNRAGEIMSEFIQDGHDFGEIMDLVLEALAVAMGNDKNDEAEAEDGEGEGEDEEK